MYSVAIRTLGRSGELLRRELESLYRQTIPPQKVVIYIAEGYPLPSFRVGDEIYVPVPKGMVAQTALDYEEIETPLLLKLDDDVEFTAPDDVERLIAALADGTYDCVAADVFKNHEMTAKQKAFAILTNLVFPHNDKRWAFKVKNNGSFAYINNPQNDVYLSQSAAGPCALWRKEALLNIRLKDELWLDQLGFAYGDDQLISQKLVKNGGKLGVLFHSGIVHNDGKSSSGAYHDNIDRFRVRAMGQYLVWHRSIYSAKKSCSGKIVAAVAFWSKVAWLVPVHCLSMVSMRSVKPLTLFVKGLRQGIAFAASQRYKSLSTYALSNK